MGRGFILSWLIMISSLGERSSSMVYFESENESLTESLPESVLAAAAAAGKLVLVSIKFRGKVITYQIEAMGLMTR